MVFVPLTFLASEACLTKICSKLSKPALKRPGSCPDHLPIKVGCALLVICFEIQHLEEKLVSGFLVALLLVDCLYLVLLVCEFNFQAVYSGNPASFLLDQVGKRDWAKAGVFKAADLSLAQDQSLSGKHSVDQTRPSARYYSVFYVRVRTDESFWLQHCQQFVQLGP